MSNARKIEVNPGEYFLVDPRAIHVKEYEAVFSATSKIGTTANDQLAYMITFTGRINNSDEVTTYTVIMSPKDAWELIGMALDQFEWLHNKMNEANKNG